MKHNRLFRYTVLLAHIFFATVSILQAQPHSVGAIPGVIDVSPMGATTYTIPIEVVPGVQGMQPNLSIVYNSMGGMGLLGMQWNLAGISSITRCGQNPYYYRDNGLTAIQFDSSDRYSLDGNRLMMIGQQSSEYATEVDNFSRIFVHNPQFSDHHFIAYTDDGSIIEYGKTGYGITQTQLLHTINLSSV